VWKEKIFPELLKLSPEPEQVFPTYSVLYQEVMMVSLLQSVLFYHEAFENLGDTSMDLVDYAVSQITKLNPTCLDDEKMFTSKDASVIEKPFEEINRQHKLINFTVGTSCISILRYIAENCDNLPLGVVSRMYSTYDVPLIVAHLLESSIWSKRGKNGKYYKFHDSTWREWHTDEPPLCDSECQAWLLLRHLLLDSARTTLYSLSDYHRDQFTKLLRLLHEVVLDQLSPLAELKHWLSQLSISAPESSACIRTPLIVEVTPQYKDTLYTIGANRWKKIAETTAKFLFYGQKEDIQFVAKVLSNNMDTLDRVTEYKNSCYNCLGKASQRCSKCKRAWYCSRKCQVVHWETHKSSCS
jgi:hypothetical protein